MIADTSSEHYRVWTCNSYLEFHWTIFCCLRIHGIRKCSFNALTMRINFQTGPIILYHYRFYLCCFQSQLIIFPKSGIRIICMWALWATTYSSSIPWHIIPLQVPYMLLTKPPKIEGASIGKEKQRQRKLSGGEDLLKCFLFVHESCAQANLGATPRRYIVFLNTYQQVYGSKKAGVEKRQHHLQVRWILDWVVTPFSWTWYKIIGLLVHVVFWIAFNSLVPCNFCAFDKICVLLGSKICW